MQSIAAAALQALQSKMPLAVKMSATRCIVKLLRKLPTDYLPSSATIEALLPSLVS